jgi:hypothetical protein
MGMSLIHQGVSIGSEHETRGITAYPDINYMKENDDISYLTCLSISEIVYGY